MRPTTIKTIEGNSIQGNAWISSNDCSFVSSIRTDTPLGFNSSNSDALINSECSLSERFAGLEKDIKFVNRRISEIKSLLLQIISQNSMQNDRITC